MIELLLSYIYANYNILTVILNHIQTLVKNSNSGNHKLRLEGIQYLRKHHSLHRQNNDLKYSVNVL